MKSRKDKRLTRIVYERLNHLFYCACTVISPTFNTKLRYRQAFGKALDLKQPETLNEKILWLKLKKYMKDPLVIQCADKYKVREYVTNCGYGHLLNDLLGVYDSAEEIDWDNLPDQFVLKWNFGAGMNIVCTDKSELDKVEVLSQLRKWGKNRYWLPNSEMQYKYIEKKIVCERLLDAGKTKGEQ